MKKFRFIIADIIFTICFITLVSCNTKKTSKVFEPKLVEFTTTDTVYMTKYSSEIQEMGSMVDSSGVEYTYMVTKDGYNIFPKPKK